VVEQPPRSSGLKPDRGIQPRRSLRARRRPLRRSRVPRLRRQAPHLPRDGGAREPARAPPRGARHRPGDHVGIYALNSVEWVETLWAVFKLRAVWININYRYVEDELRYLFDNADLKALVYQRQFAPRVAGVLRRCRSSSTRSSIEDGSGEDIARIGSVQYEDAIAARSPERDFAPRSASDRYILYTGGTTGMPKGVVWRHEDVFMALGGGIDPMTNVRAERPEFMVEKAKMGVPLTFLPIAPLMHGATQWAVMGQSFLGTRSS
jgi:acyl-CoA synthetase (AMP-forming)/AMP-acid ligase II